MGAYFKDRLERTFVDLIYIDEVYGEEYKIINYVTTVFKELGLHHTVDPFGNVICFMEGDGEPVMLNTHMDIPEKLKNLIHQKKGDTIHSNGKSILGADPKSGMAVLLEFAKHLKAKSSAHRPIEFVFTVGEEAGLIGARNLKKNTLRSKIGLVLDEDGPCTNVVIQAPGYYKIDIEVQGKTSHTRDWREGINAITVITHALSQLQQGEIAPGVTFNVGTISAGTARNSIPGIAKLQIDMRSFDNKSLLEQGKLVENTFHAAARHEGAKLSIHSGLEFKDYELDADSRLLKHLNMTYRKQGIEPNYYQTYGGSDANIFNAYGIETAAIGSGYYLAHQYNERVDLQDMEELLLFLDNFTSVH